MRKWTIGVVALVACFGFSDARVTAESQVTALVNNARSSGVRCNGGGGVKLNRLTYNAKLAIAAENHARNMGSRRFVSHYYKGVGPRTRVVRAGYNFSRMSEIIFLGNGGASRAVNWWKNSRVHCQAMMNRNYTQVGAGYYNGAWVVVMARPK
jgi:uncharacterized protein YkwD